MSAISPSIDDNFFNNESFQLAVLWKNPQKPYTFCTYDFSVLVIVLDGHGIYYNTKTERILTRGDVFTIKKNRTHGYKNLNNLVSVNVVFNLDALEFPVYDLTKSSGFHGLFSNNPVPDSRFSESFRLNKSQLIEVLNLVRKTDLSLCGHKPGYRLVAVSWFMQLIQKVTEIYDKHYQHRVYDYPGPIDEALRYIDKHYDRNINISDLTNHLGVSESTLFRMFKRVTGLSPVNYIQRKKIQKAAKLLKSSQLSITDIAYISGFADSNYFSRVFRKIMKMRPLQYRGG